MDQSGETILRLRSEKKALEQQIQELLANHMEISKDLHNANLQLSEAEREMDRLRSLSEGDPALVHALTKERDDAVRLLSEANGLLQRFLDAGPEEEYQVILCRLSTDVEAFLRGKSQRPNRVADENQPHTYWCREHSLLMPKESLCPKCVEKLTEKRIDVCTCNGGTFPCKLHG